MAKVKVLQKERSMWVAKNVEWLQVWLLTLLLYDLDAHFCSFILKVSFFLHQCTLRSPAFFWWFRPRLAYWTYMSMISNYICYGPYYKCNLLLIAYTQTIPDSKSKSKSLNPRTYRVGHKFSDTWNELFVVNWFISKKFWGNTKWKKVSSPHYLKILIKLSKHGISYSLKRDPRSISKITFYAILSVSPIEL